MMTMAHHPQIKSRQDRHANQERQQAVPTDRVFDVSKIKITSNTTKPIVDSDYQNLHINSLFCDPQDGKRTLIKNQLYIIEQLQLENADLRNERDQLQLENEELKFQLQMISSSNILNQPGRTFKSPSLASESGAKTALDCVNRVSAGKTVPTNGNATINNIANQVKLLATPLRLPNRLKAEEKLQTYNLTSSLFGRSSSRSPNSEDVNNQEPKSTKITRGSGQVYNKSLGCKSTSSISIYVEGLNVSSVSRSRQPPPDEDEELLKQFEQTYGDIDRVQAASIVIQRAFRKHQICQRFRAITEQLRHAHQPGSQQQQPSKRRSEPSSPTSDDAQTQPDLTFASGTTRAAAWESLSYAASKLTAAAAAASSISKVPNDNHQLTKSPINQGTNVILRSKVKDPPQVHNNSNGPTKAEAVVDAALNFQQLESIRKRQYRVGLNVFNKHPEKGVSFLIAHSFIDSSPPFAKNSHSYYHSNQLHFIDKQNVLHDRAVATMKDSTTDCQSCCEEDNLKRNVAHFLLHRKGLAKEKIGQYLGNLQEPFNQDVLRYYLQELDFNDQKIDLALRKFLSTFRLPGEAQKIERIVDCFAQRYVQCQMKSVSDTSKKNAAQLSFIENQSQKISDDQNLTQQFNTPNYNLHSPSLKPTSRMSSSQFVNNLRGVFKSHNVNEDDLIEIYDRVKANQITTTPDHVSHVMKVQQSLTVNNFQKKELPNLCVPHRRLVCFCRLFEVYDIAKKERVGQHQREIFLFNDLLLVTKLARRVRANSIQLYMYRQSIPLKGLQVQVFQSQHYLYGIRLCQRSNDETLIMFNARNELDQSRFVDDLSESIAEMDEMEMIRSHNFIETIHFRQQERFRRHAMSHAVDESIENGSKSLKKLSFQGKHELNVSELDKENVADLSPVPCINRNRDSTLPTLTLQDRKARGKFSSMLNLSKMASDSGQGKQSRSDHSFVPNLSQTSDKSGSHNDSGSSGQRRSSTGSVHSLDSGLFLSRDISPNQSN